MIKHKTAEGVFIEQTSPAPLAYSINDACKLVSLGRTTLWRLVKEEKLRAVKIGGRTLIPVAELNRLINGE